MARLDRAIHGKLNAFRMLLGCRVKPGHDSKGRLRFFHTLKDAA